MLATTIDLALGILLVFLIFGLITSGAYEALARGLRWRSKDLWASVRKLLEPQQNPAKNGPVERVLGVSASPATRGDARPKGSGGGGLVGDLYLHPLVGQLESLASDTRTKIDHIDPQSFAGALIDIAVPGGATTASEVRDGLANLPNFPLKQPLMELANEAAESADKKLEAFRDKASALFDAQMTQLSKLYRRRAKWWMFLIGLIVAVVANVDTIHVADELYHNEALRKASADAVSDIADACEDEEPGTPLKECLNTELGEVEDSNLELELLVGWADDRSTDDIAVWWVVGWVITAAALAQGGPFWFDLIKRISGYRKTG